MKKPKTLPQRTKPPETKLNTLRPLPVRITQRQYLRLVAHREIDQLAIQEHVRRALDLYLDDLDWRRTIQLGGTPGDPPSVMSRPHPNPTQNPGQGPDENADAAEPTGVQSKKPKLVYR